MSAEAMDLATYSQEMASQDQTIGYELEPDNARPPAAVPESVLDLEDEEPAPSSSILKLLDTADITRASQASKNSSGKPW